MHLARDGEIYLGFKWSSIYLLVQKSTSWPYVVISLEIATHSGEKFNLKNRQLMIRALRVTEPFDEYSNSMARSIEYLKVRYSMTFKFRYSNIVYRIYSNLCINILFGNFNRR